MCEEAKLRSFSGRSLLCNTISLILDTLFLHLGVVKVRVVDGVHLEELPFFPHQQGLLNVLLCRDRHTGRNPALLAGLHGLLKDILLVPVVHVHVLLAGLDPFDTLLILPLLDGLADGGLLGLNLERHQQPVVVVSEPVVLRVHLLHQLCPCLFRRRRCLLLKQLPHAGKVPCCSKVFVSPVARHLLPFSVQHPRSLAAVALPAQLLDPAFPVPFLAEQLVYLVVEVPDPKLPEAGILYGCNSF